MGHTSLYTHVRVYLWSAIPLLGSALRDAIVLSLIFGRGLKRAVICFPALLHGGQCNGIKITSAREEILFQAIED